MSELPPPSTGWRENIAPGETERHEEWARLFADIQSRRARRWGAGRTLHRKQLAAARGTLEVLDGLPEFARQGLFATPGQHEAWVRLSNGGLDRAADRVPDIRGFGLKVLGVQGEAAQGGTAGSQDFTLINHEAFAFSGSEEFVAFVGAAARGNGELLKHMLRRYGLLGGPRVLARVLRSAAKSFSGFATEPLHSVLPLANGAYAVRVRLLPVAANGTPSPRARDDWGADFADRLRQHDLAWELQLQYFADEKLTPIEDAAVVWPTPYTTVARLVLPRQDLGDAAAQAFAEQVESCAIDPWGGLAAHRPLGDVQRARRAVYRASQGGRRAS